MKLSVLVKTFNEEAKIAKCLDAVLAAVADIEGGVEIIVADSLSTDQTIRIACSYNVKVVQLSDVGDRGSGTGVQLGFQYSSGQYIYLLDGDMELQKGFLEQALELFEREEKIGGVAGLLKDNQINNWFDRHRLKNKPTGIAGEMEWLSGGGLYSRKAIDDAGGYAGNRNLRGFEEAELGLRLRSRGWRLMRLPMIAILHTGHSDSTTSLILRHWHSGRLNSSGVLLKMAAGKPWFFRVVRLFVHPLVVFIYWVAVFFLLMFGKYPFVLYAFLDIGLITFCILVLKKKSIIDACLSVLLWHISVLGMIRGIIIQKLKVPQNEIPSVIVQ